MDDLITSAEAAKLAGVGTTAIKRWADSGRLPCLRTAGGHRRFDRQQFQLWLRGGGKKEDDWSEWVADLVHVGDIHRIHARLFTDRAHRGSWHAVAAGLGGLLDEIGQRWQDGRLSVIEEHLASSLLQRALATVAETIPVAPEPRCLLAVAEGETHTLGLSLIELCLREAGWRAEWAGSHTRAADIIERIQQGGIRMVAVSASAAASDAAALAISSAQIGAACQPTNVALVLGGEGAWPDAPVYGTRFRSLTPFYEFARELL